MWVAVARQGGLQLTPIAGSIGLSGDDVFVLVDDREPLAGSLLDPSQARVTRNRTLVALARARRVIDTQVKPDSSDTADSGTDWVAWESNKHRRLRLLMGGNDVA